MTPRFSYREASNGSVRIFEGAGLVTTLQGKHAARFLSQVEAAGDADAAQLVMARATGQFKFGNEKAGKRKRGRQGRTS